jgi:Protein of unknown function (DUF2865)
MVATAIARLLRRCGAALLVMWTVPALAQLGFPPPQGSAPGPACLRLESQLAAIDRGGASLDPARAEQIKRYEDAAAKQQGELDRLGEQSRRLGCQGGGFFALFSGQSPQCGPLNNQIQQVRANIDRYLMEIQRLQGNSGEREAQRRGILVALGQNDCGPQYRQYAHGSGPGGVFDRLFGGNFGSNFGGTPDASSAGTYRTLCVRTCDGYYFPISYSTVPTRFAEDERLCQRLCPASETILFSHRNPGEDVTRAVSSGGRLYSDLPQAFSYRKQLNPACSCRAPGQSWAEALRQVDDHTVERGDIVVTEERAKQLSQPRVDAQGRPVSLDPNPARPGATKPAPVTATPLAPAATVKPAPAPVEEAAAEEDRSRRKVRGVGPAFYPER